MTTKHELTVFVTQERFDRLNKIASQAEILPDDFANRVLNFALDVLNLDAVYLATSRTSAWKAPTLPSKPPAAAPTLRVIGGTSRSAALAVAIFDTLEVTLRRHQPQPTSYYLAGSGEDITVTLCARATMETLARHIERAYSTGKRADLITALKAEAERRGYPVASQRVAP